MREYWRSQRSPLRAAFEDCKPDEFFAALRADVSVDARGCWVWQRKVTRKKRVRSAYPAIKFGGRSMAVHRLSAEMRHGDLDGQPVHHMCANTLCVNPDHLQPISHRENIAEMLQRNYFVDRIERLEEALREWAPLHPLLNSATSDIA